MRTSFGIRLSFGVSAKSFWSFHLGCVIFSLLEVKNLLCNLNMRMRTSILSLLGIWTSKDVPYWRKTICTFLTSLPELLRSFQFSEVFVIEALYEDVTFELLRSFQLMR